MQHFLLAGFIVLLAIGIWIVIPIFALIFSVGLAIWVLGELILLDQEDTDDKS